MRKFKEAVGEAVLGYLFVTIGRAAYDVAIRRFNESRNTPK